MRVPIFLGCFSTSTSPPQTGCYRVYVFLLRLPSTGTMTMADNSRSFGHGAYAWVRVEMDLNPQNDGFSFRCPLNQSKRCQEKRTRAHTRNHNLTTHLAHRHFSAKEMNGNYISCFRVPIHLSPRKGDAFAPFCGPLSCKEHGRLLSPTFGNLAAALMPWQVKHLDPDLDNLYNRAQARPGLRLWLKYA